MNIIVNVCIHTIIGFLQARDILRIVSNTNNLELMNTHFVRKFYSTMNNAVCISKN